MKKIQTLLLMHVEKGVLLLVFLGCAAYVGILAMTPSPSEKTEDVERLMKQIEDNRRASKPPKLTAEDYYAKMKSPFERIPALTFPTAWRFYPFPKVETKYDWKANKPGTPPKKRIFPLRLTDIQEFHILEGSEYVKVSLVPEVNRVEVLGLKSKNEKEPGVAIVEYVAKGGQMKEVHRYEINPPEGGPEEKFVLKEPAELNVEVQRGRVLFSFKRNPASTAHLHGFRVYRKQIDKDKQGGKGVEYKKVQTIEYTPPPEEKKEVGPGMPGATTTSGDDEEGTTRPTAQPEKKRVVETIESIMPTFYEDTDIRPDTTYMYAVDAYGANQETGEDMETKKVEWPEEVTTVSDSEIFYTGVFEDKALVTLRKWKNNEEYDDQAFQFLVGQPLGEKKKVRKGKEEVLVDFDTGAVLVDIQDGVRVVQEVTVKKKVVVGGKVETVEVTEQYLKDRTSQIVVLDAKGRGRVFPKTKVTAPTKPGEDKSDDKKKEGKKEEKKGDDKKGIDKKVEEKTDELKPDEKKSATTDEKPDPRKPVGDKPEPKKPASNVPEPAKPAS